MLHVILTTWMFFHSSVSAGFRSSSRGLMALSEIGRASPFIGACALNGGECSPLLW